MRKTIKELINSGLSNHENGLVRGLLAFCIPFGVYLLTLAPTVYNLDSAELTTAAATLGITRATGYPLYILIGHIWTHLPFGDVGYRMNLFSAFNGALAIALTDRIFHRLGISAWASLGAVLMLAFSFYFWALSLIAEVYTFQVALISATIYMLLKWKESTNDRNLALVAFLIGCSFSNHLSTVLLVPGYIWFILSEGWKKALTKSALIVASLGFLAGISFYLYLPIRYTMSPPFNYAGHYDGNGIFHPLNLTTLRNFLWLVTGKGFFGFMFGYDLAGTKLEITQFVKLMWNAFMGIGIGPGILGLIVLIRSKWKFGVMSLLMFAGHAIFFIGYRTVDKELMFLPCFLIWAIWLAVGFEWIIRILKETFASENPVPGHAFSTITSLAILGIVVFTCARNWQYVDQSKNWSAREHGEMILSQVEPNALLIGYWNTVPIIEYFQRVEGQRQDIKAINRFLISPQNLARLIENEAGQRLIYMDDLPMGLPATIDIQVGATLYIISKE